MTLPRINNLTKRPCQALCDLPDLFAGAHRFDDLDPGPIEFGIMFGAYEHAANHSRCPTGYQESIQNRPLHCSIFHTDH